VELVDLLSPEGVTVQERVAALYGGGNTPKVTFKAMVSRASNKNRGTKELRPWVRRLQ
jgi:hypothetical protein